jgi:hypothetical protein
VVGEASRIQLTEERELNNLLDVCCNGIIRF